MKQTNRGYINVEKRKQKDKQTDRQTVREGRKDRWTGKQIKKKQTDRIKEREEEKVKQMDT